MTRSGASSTRSWTITAGALGLLAASLAVLAVGGFIQFDDTSGFGSYKWVLPLGMLAGVIALSSVAVALFDVTARRVHGAVMAGLAVVLVVLAAVDDGLRFIWAGDEEELGSLQLVLLLGGLLLLTPTFFTSQRANEVHPPRTLTPWARGVVDLFALVVLAMVAFNIGAANFVSTQCSGPDFDGDCDLAGLAGTVWMASALLIGLVVIAITELLRSARRRRAARVAL